MAQRRDTLWGFFLFFKSGKQSGSGAAKRPDTLTINISPEDIEAYRPPCEYISFRKDCLKDFRLKNNLIAAVTSVSLKYGIYIEHQSFDLFSYESAESTRSVRESKDYKRVKKVFSKKFTLCNSDVFLYGGAKAEKMACFHDGRFMIPESETSISYLDVDRAELVDGKPFFTYSNGSTASADFGFFNTILVDIVQRLREEEEDELLFFLDQIDYETSHRREPFLDVLMGKNAEVKDEKNALRLRSLKESVEKNLFNRSVSSKDDWDNAFTLIRYEALSSKLYYILTRRVHYYDSYDQEAIDKYPEQIKDLAERLGDRTGTPESIWNNRHQLLNPELCQITKETVSPKENAPKEPQVSIPKFRHFCRNIMGMGNYETEQFLDDYTRIKQVRAFVAGKAANPSEMYQHWIEGKGSNNDQIRTEAEMWREAAAINGHYRAIYNMAWTKKTNLIGKYLYDDKIYEHITKTKDWIALNNWYTAAIYCGYLEAMYEYGALLLKTEFKKRGEKYLTEAAELGHAEAMYALAYWYFRPDGCAPKPEVALYWFKEARDFGEDFLFLSDYIDDLEHREHEWFEYGIDGKMYIPYKDDNRGPKREKLFNHTPIPRCEYSEEYIPEFIREMDRIESVYLKYLRQQEQN